MFILQLFIMFLVSCNQFSQGYSNKLLQKKAMPGSYGSQLHLLAGKSGRIAKAKSKSVPLNKIKNAPKLILEALHKHANAKKKGAQSMELISDFNAMRGLARHGRVDKIRALLNKKTVDLRAKGRAGRTVLSYAMQGYFDDGCSLDDKERSFQVIQLLLKHDSEPRLECPGDMLNLLLDEYAKNAYSFPARDLNLR